MVLTTLVGDKEERGEIGEEEANAARRLTQRRQLEEKNLESGRHNELNDPRRA